MSNTAAQPVGAVSPFSRKNGVRLSVMFMVVVFAATAIALSRDAASPAAADSADALLTVIDNTGSLGGDSYGATVRVNGPGGFTAQCDYGFYPPEDDCTYTTFAQGDTVTLTATAVAPVQFKGWSDDRCPTGPVLTCQLTLADAQTVIAYFSPVGVVVSPEGADGSTVQVSDAAGHKCTAVNIDGVPERCTFDLYSQLTLVATDNDAGQQPQWNPADCTVVADADPQREACTETLAGEQRFNVGFGALPTVENRPPKVDVIFRARTTGSGSGVIRGDLECGTRCSVKKQFREPVKLVADPAAGSRFVGWTGGCGTAPTCTLQAAATSVTAEFERASIAPDSVARTGPRSLQPAPGRFRALIGKIQPTGRGTRRQIQIQIGVNAPASVRAKLVKGKRTFKNKVFSIQRGIWRVTLGVPKRAKAGRYRLKLTVRDRKGSAPVRVAYTVHLKR